MKRKILAALLSVCLFVGLAVPAFAEENSTAPWTADSGSVTVAEGGKWLLMGSETASEGMYQGPYVKWTESIGDISNGLTMSVTLDATNIKKNELFEWSFGVDGAAPAAERLAEAVFSFQSEEDGEATLLSVAGKAPKTAVKGNSFKIKITFNAGAEGKLSATATVNGTKITLDGETLTSPGGSADTLYSAVKGPRYGWLCNSTVTAGILATEPKAVAVTPVVSPLTEETYTNSEGKETHYIFANGNPVVIEDAGEENISISSENGDLWLTCKGDNAIVFGGGKDRSFDSSSITMNSGTIYSLIGGGYGKEGSSADVTNTRIEMTGGTVKNAIGGGGYHWAQVQNATINVTGGTITNIQGGGFASVGGSEGKPSGTKEVYTQPKLAKNRVETVNVVIDGGETPVTLLANDGIFGGGQGYSYVGTANLTVKNAKGPDEKCWVVGGGSNGYTGTANVTIGDGAEIAILQGSNRGTVENIDIKMTGGKVINFYCGGEDNGTPATSSGLPNDKINGLSKKIEVSITRGSVTKLAPGINGAIDNNPGADGPAMDEAGIISGEYKRTSVANYKTLLTTERYGTAFANLLPIEETTQVENIDTTGKNDTEIKDAVADATKGKVNDGTIQNGDTAFAATAKAPDNLEADKKTEVEGKIQALLTATENVPAAENVQKENATDKTITYLVSNLSKVEASEGGKLESVTFDVTPYEHEVGGTTAPTAKETLGKTITFRLPIPDDWADYPCVKVEHKGKVTYHDVMTADDGTKYIEVSASSFSPFVLTPSATRPTPTPTPTPSYSSGSVSSEFYVTVIAGANGKAKEPEGFYARDERHTFTMIPDEGYVIDTVTLDDGSVLSHTDTEFVLFVDEPYEVHVTFKKAAGSTTTAPTGKPPVSANPQTGDSWFSGLF